VGAAGKWLDKWPLLALFTDQALTRNFYKERFNMTAKLTASWLLACRRWNSG